MRLIDGYLSVVGEGVGAQEKKRKNRARSKLDHHPLSCSVEQCWKTTMPLDRQNKPANPVQKQKFLRHGVYPEPTDLRLPDHHIGARAPCPWPLRRMAYGALVAGG